MYPRITWTLCKDCGATLDPGQRCKCKDMGRKKRIEMGFKESALVTCQHCGKDSIVFISSMTLEDPKVDGYKTSAICNCCEKRTYSKDFPKEVNVILTLVN